MEKGVSSRKTSIAWFLAAIFTVLLVTGLGMLKWRRSASMDRPRPVTETDYGPTTLKMLALKLGLGGYPDLFLEKAELAAIEDCIRQSRLTRSSHNGITDFERMSTHDALMNLRDRLARPFYAEFLLAQWYETNHDPNEAARWLSQALAHAPVVLIRRYELMDGRPLVNTPVGQLGVEYRFRTPTQVNGGLVLDYVNLTTDDKGQVYLPGYDTKIRCNSAQWPPGYEVETGRHGYLALHGRYNRLPTIYAWPKGVRRPATTLPPSEFYDYRNAVAAQGLTHRVGLAEFTIDRCYRMGGDGRVTVTDGRAELTAEGEPLPAFDDRAGVLDQAIVHVKRNTRESHAILQVRVFDHRSRGLLTKYYAPADYEYDGDSRITLHSLGRELPERVDVWFWVTEFSPNQSKLIVPAKVGSRAKKGQHSVELTAVHRGRGDYSMTSGPNGVSRVAFTEPDDEHAKEVQVALRIRGNEGGSAERYARVGLVTKDGQRHFSDYVLRLDNVDMVFDFGVPLSEVDHFEVLPVGEERCFYFDGVLLPERSGAALEPTGALDFQVRTDGTTGSFTSDTTAPVRVAITVLEGHGGMSSGIRGGMEDPKSDSRWKPFGPYTQTATHSTIVCEIRGLSTRMLRTEILDWSGSPFAQIRGTGRGGSICYQSQAVPVAEIQGVHVRLSCGEEQ